MCLFPNSLKSAFGDGQDSKHVSTTAADYHSPYFTLGSKTMTKSFERLDPLGTQYETCRRPRHYCPHLVILPLVTTM